MTQDIPRRRLAFTLIELLITVLIIAILASLLLPALSKAKASARSAQCKSNLRQLALLLRLYVDNEGHYPIGTGIAPTVGAKWQYSIGARTGTFSPIPPPRMGVKDQSVAHCPGFASDTADEYLHASYGYNAWDGSARFDPATDPPFGRGLGGAPQGVAGWKPVPESGVLNPSDTYALADSFASTENGRLMFGNGMIGRNWIVTGGFPASYFGESEKAARSRHGGKLNVALCDGHVESIPVRDFLLNNAVSWKKRWHNQNIP